MTEPHNELPSNDDTQGFQKAGDTAFETLNSLQNTQESTSEASDKVEESKPTSEDEKRAEAKRVESEAALAETEKVAAEDQVDAKEDEEEKRSFVSPHVYDTPKTAEPSGESTVSTPETPRSETTTSEPAASPAQPAAPEPQVVQPGPIPVVTATEQPSHRRKPWFYVVTGGLAGLLIGAACVAGCTSVALHTGYGKNAVETVRSTQAQEASRDSEGTDGAQTERDSESRDYDNYGYGHNHDYNDDRGYGYDHGYGSERGYGYSNPYGYGYGYGLSPYGYGYPYSPYGYGYGYSNPYGYGYGSPYDYSNPYGYGNPYGYENPYDYSNPYGYDLEDLLEEYFGYGDESGKSDDSSRDESNNEDRNQDDSNLYGYGNGGGIFDLYDLFGGEEFDEGTATEESTVTLDQILDNFDLPLGDVSGTSFGAGVYVVGEDGIAPGLYYVEGSPSQESNFYLYETDGAYRGDDLYKIDAAVAYIGSYFVELEEGDVLIYKPAEDSDVFYSADEAPKVEPGVYGSGVYRVGVDIPAGTYTITATSESLDDATQDRAVYVMKDLDFDEDSILDTKYVMKGGSQTIEVKDGQWVELYGAQAELQK